jgi:hypothetical protein
MDIDLRPFAINLVDGTGHSVSAETRAQWQVQWRALCEEWETEDAALEAERDVLRRVHQSLQALRDLMHAHRRAARAEEEE